VYLQGGGAVRVARPGDWSVSPDRDGRCPHHRPARLLDLEVVVGPRVEGHGLDGVVRGHDDGGAHDRKADGDREDVPTAVVNALAARGGNLKPHHRVQAARTRVEIELGPGLNIDDPPS